VLFSQRQKDDDKRKITVVTVNQISHRKITVSLRE